MNNINIYQKERNNVFIYGIIVQLKNFILRRLAVAFN